MSEYSDRIAEIAERYITGVKAALVKTGLNTDRENVIYNAIIELKRNEGENEEIDDILEYLRNEFTGAKKKNERKAK